MWHQTHMCRPISCVLQKMYAQSPAQKGSQLGSRKGTVSSHGEALFRAAGNTPLTSGKRQLYNNIHCYTDIHISFARARHLVECLMQIPCGARHLVRRGKLADMWHMPLGARPDRRTTFFSSSRVLTWTPTVGANFARQVPVIEKRGNKLLSCVLDVHPLTPDRTSRSA